MIIEQEEHPEKNLRVLVDWLNFTIKDLTLSQVFDLIGISESEFVDMPRGLYFYAKQKVCGDIRVLWEGTNGMDMGIHVQFSGQGCREFETFYNGDWLELFHRVRSHDGHFSRFDIACDEFRWNGERPYFTVGQLIRKTKRGEARSKWKNLNRMEKVRISDGVSQGHTAYFGSALSDIQLRVYEKNKERVNAGKMIEEELTTWNRAELQLSDHRAEETINALIGGVHAGDIFFRLVKNYINFTDRLKGDDNKGRWPVSQWWLDYLGGVDKLQLAMQAPDKTIEAKKEWINRQVNPTFAEIWVAEGSPGESAFWDMIHDGLSRMTEAQWARADNFRMTKERETNMHKERRVERRAQQLELASERSRRYRAEIAAAYQEGIGKEKEPFASALSNELQK